MPRDRPDVADVKPPRVVNCPRCGHSVEWTPESRFRPVCSERCRLLDLGAWANEEFRIPLAEDPAGDTHTTPDATGKS